MGSWIAGRGHIPAKAFVEVPQPEAGQVLTADPDDVEPYREADKRPGPVGDVVVREPRVAVRTLDFPKFHRILHSAYCHLGPEDVPLPSPELWWSRPSSPLDTSGQMLITIHLGASFCDGFTGCGLDARVGDDLLQACQLLGCLDASLRMGADLGQARLERVVLRDQNHLLDASLLRSLESVVSALESEGKIVRVLVGGVVDVNDSHIRCEGIHGWSPITDLVKQFRLPPWLTW